MDKKHGLNTFFNIETLIILVIAACMIFLNIFTVTKLNELESAEHEAVFLMDNVDFNDKEEFTEEIQNYLTGSYKMIELYDQDLELIFQIQFSDKYIEIDDIKQHTDLVNIIKNNKEGQTEITVDDMEQEVYFKWVTNNSGETRLLMVYSAIKIVKGIWLFSFICWMVMILIFVLLIRLHSRSYQDRIDEYRKMTFNLRD